MAKRLPPDFFDSQFGTQAALMNAWILWRHQEDLEPWTKEDLISALPCVTPSAVEPHLRRLARDARRGGYLSEDGSGYRLAPDILPDQLH
jgi:hypothetical protein